MIERTYGHHHPDYMQAAAEAITSKQPQNVSLVVSLVEPENAPNESAKKLMNSWWAREDSNLQPSGYEPLALTIELRARAGARAGGFLTAIMAASLCRDLSRQGTG